MTGERAQAALSLLFCARLWVAEIEIGVLFVSRSRGSYLPVVLSFVFLLACAGVFAAVATGSLPGMRGADSSQEPSEEGSSDLTAKAFSSYSWEELASIADIIESAGSEDEGLAVAREFGIVGDDGSLRDCVRQVVFTDGSVGTCRVVGVLEDEKADGTGKAALTFALTGLPKSAMNASATCEGGWESSEARSWLQGEARSLLPADLAPRVASVLKSTNNAGIASDTSSVTQTGDALWLFSASEIYGELTWFSQEYGDDPIYNTSYTDFGPYDQLISSEGAQYRYFAQTGVHDRDSYAAVGDMLGSADECFWLRTPYPLRFSDADEGMFFQVMGTGYPSSAVAASQENGILAGFCL